MHLQCRSLADAQVVNEINSPPSSHVKIDLIGVTEKMAKNQPCKNHGDYKNEGLKSSLNSHEEGQDNLNG